MSSKGSDSSDIYKPDYQINLPPLFEWPPRPLAALRWLFFGMLFPWGFIFIGLSLLSWYYLTPSLGVMSELRPGWITLIWLRNAALLTLVAGSLHSWLYISRSRFFLIDDTLLFYPPCFALANSL